MFLNAPPLRHSGPSKILEVPPSRSRSKLNLFLPLPRRIIDRRESFTSFSTLLQKIVPFSQKPTTFSVPGSSLYLLKFERQIRVARRTERLHAGRLYFITIIARAVCAVIDRQTASGCIIHRTAAAS